MRVAIGSVAVMATRCRCGALPLIPWPLCTAGCNGSSNGGDIGIHGRLHERRGEWQQVEQEPRLASLFWLVLLSSFPEASPDCYAAVMLTVMHFHVPGTLDGRRMRRPEDHAAGTAPCKSHQVPDSGNVFTENFRFPLCSASVVRRLWRGAEGCGWSHPDRFVCGMPGRSTPRQRHHR